MTPTSNLTKLKRFEWVGQVPPAKRGVFFGVHNVGYPMVIQDVNERPSQAATAARAKRNWGVGFGVFVVVLAGVWWLMKVKFDADKVPESYQYVAKFEKGGIPAIEAVDLNGKAFDLAKVTTPVVIVNFWASWCGPCVEEFPSMLKLVDALDGKVTIVAVSMDDDEKDLRAFTKLFKVPRKSFEVLWDRDKKVMQTYAVGKLPESYIVGPDRKLIRKVLGIENWATAGAIAYFKSLAAAAEAKSDSPKSEASKADPSKK